MSMTKVAITLDPRALRRVDALVRAQVFPSRSAAIQGAVDEHLARRDRTRLARECAKLDPAEERRFAGEGLREDLKTWPEY